MIKKDNKATFEQIQMLLTEQRNPNTMNIDKLDIEDILKLINNEDKKVADAVCNEIPYIAKAVELVVDSFIQGGRLIYVGAGTSGRLGVLDAAECPPTFGTDSDMVQGIIAGGKKAMFRSIEGAEDNVKQAIRDIDNKRVNNKDVVCGIAASIRTPYVCSAICRAKQRGAKTIFITTNSRSTLNSADFSALSKSIDVAICPCVGPEVIMGSTRMKSGTAQKLVLNMISTSAMIRLGKVYENMMVDLKAWNTKLRERAKRILMIATGVSYEEATRVLKSTAFDVKLAIVIIKTGLSKDEAKKKLKSAKGSVHIAVNEK